MTHLLLLLILAAPPAPPEALRIVAVGDLHGDLAATRTVLRLAGVIDDRDRWSGGSTVLVQTGDILGRGADERAILDLLERLGREAPAAGGRVVVVNGNHELMNVQGSHGYVAAGAWATYRDLPVSEREHAWFEERGVRAELRPRLAAFRPGGTYARLLAGHPVSAVVDGVVFAHGGVLPRHVEYGLDRIDRDVALWMRGDGPAPALLDAVDAPWWTRRYSSEPDRAACDLARRTLAALKARRMVVGHTPQKGGIQVLCGGLVIAIDVGLSSHYGGPKQVLELVGERVRILDQASAGSGPPR